MLAFCQEDEIQPCKKGKAKVLLAHALALISVVLYLCFSIVTPNRNLCSEMEPIETVPEWRRQMY